MKVAIFILSALLSLLGLKVPRTSSTPPIPPSPLQSPSSSPTTKPIAVKQSDKVGLTSDGSLSSWIYPGAATTILNSSIWTGSTNDNVQNVIDWYKNKVKNEKMNSVSLSQNTTNSITQVSLSAAKPNLTVNIKIIEEGENSTIKISVDVGI